MQKDSAPVKFHMVLRSRVTKQLKSIATLLPKDMILNILVCLPADILYAVMRYVCRQWYNIISDPGFVTAHLLRCTSIFLVEFRKSHYQYLHVGDCKTELSDIQFQFPGRVRATCNGLILVQDRRYQTTHRLYYIENPVTNRMMTLPTFPLNETKFSLVFAASSNAYKVVVVTEDGGFPKCTILTVGVDRAWRIIDCANDFSSLLYYGLITGRRFLYWVVDVFPYMLALKIESEIIKTISLPQNDRINGGGRGSFVPKGDTISYIQLYWDFSIKVWVLKDHETQDWIKYPDLRVDLIRREATNLFSLKRISFSYRAAFCHPVSWLKNEEKIIFAFCITPYYLFVYDVKTGDTSTFEFYSHGRILPHITSLAWV